MELNRLRSRRWRPWALSLAALVLVGAGLGIGLSLTLGNETPAHASGGTSGQQPSGGNGPGLKVANPPPAHPKAPAAGVVSTPMPCSVPIRNSYDKLDWSSQAQCFGPPAIGDTFLATIRNTSRVPVFINEWYFFVWHGETPLAPGQTKTIPLWDAADVYVGACWPGTKPGTCQGGPEGRVANVVLLQRETATNFHELWFRDENSVVIPVDQGPVTAINRSLFPVQLHWRQLGEGKWVEIPPGGHTQEIPPQPERRVTGKKPFGTGEAARVAFAGTGGNANYYTLINPGRSGPGSPPQSTMTYLFDSWCSVHLENIGKGDVILWSWAFPGPPLGHQTSKGISLKTGQGGTLKMDGGTFEINGQVGIGAPGSSTVIKATSWVRCQSS